MPCERCHKQALIYFSPDKYSPLMEEEELVDIAPPEHRFRLPFEFDDDDNLGPWDILLSEDTIKDMRRLESPRTIKAVMKKLGQISSGAWNKHGLLHKVQTHAIPVYNVEISGNDDLRIL